MRSSAAAVLRAAAAVIVWCTVAGVRVGGGGVEWREFGKRKSLVIFHHARMIHNSSLVSLGVCPLIDIISIPICEHPYISDLVACIQQQSLAPFCLCTISCSEAQGRGSYFFDFLTSRFVR